MRGLAHSIRNFSKKQWMYITDIFLKTPLSIYFNFFNFLFENLSSQTWGAAYLRVRLIRRCLRYSLNMYKKRKQSQYLSMINYGTFLSWKQISLAISLIRLKWKNKITCTCKSFLLESYNIFSCINEKKIL